MKIKPRLLDLFCGAGGAAMGYHHAGFDVLGVDNQPQPNYPFEFIQADAMDILRQWSLGISAYTPSGTGTWIWGENDFDVYHLSPPCQAYTRLTPPEHRDKHPDLIAEIREYLLSPTLRFKPYVIENVPDARKLLINPVMLCGTMFKLPTHRHRYFEIRPEFFSLLPPCARIKKPVVVSGTTRRKTGRFEYRISDVKRAMDIDWMNRAELDEAIPPAYTEYIGKYLMEAIALIERG